MWASCWSQEVCSLTARGIFISSCPLPQKLSPPCSSGQWEEPFILSASRITLVGNHCFGWHLEVSSCAKILWFPINLLTLTPCYWGRKNPDLHRMHLTRPGSSVLTALASELDHGWLCFGLWANRMYLVKYSGRAMAKQGNVWKKTLEVLSSPLILFLNPAKVRTALFRVKPDSHFLDGATEIDAPRPGDKQNVWEDSQVHSQTSPALLRNTSVFVLQ